MYRVAARVWAGTILAVMLAGTFACADLAPPDPCEPIDPVLEGSSFVLVSQPRAGERSSSPLRVAGCSRTFESNVVWELRARDGSVLASGHTTGGGVSGAAAFSFSAPFAVPTAQLAHLEVQELDASDGEGFPGGRNVIPLILLSTPAAGDAESGGRP